MCGTPVAGIRCGGLPEVVTGPGGLLVRDGAGVVDRLASAVDRVVGVNRDLVAAHARRDLHRDRMIDGYERLIVELSDDATPRSSDRALA